MHDPMTVAHEIYLGPKKNKKGNYRLPLITIWHVDPEKDGTDDSCGWFKRSRHGNKEVFEEIVKEFLFNLKHNYWFDANGYRAFSTSGVLLNMYSAALWIHFKRNRKKQRSFLRKWLYDILNFAENPTDCMGDSITRKFGGEINEDAMRQMASSVYGDILRKTTPWYRHPRWHIHHWKIQFVFWERWFKKREQPSKNVDQVLRDTA